MIKAVVFDIDGVLVDSSEVIVEFLRRAVEKGGYKRPSRAEIAKTNHMTLKNALKQLIETEDDSEIDRLVNIALEPGAVSTHLYNFPNEFDDVLCSLKTKYKLGIVTSRLRVGVDEVFEAKRMRHYFDVVVTADDYINHKPHPEPIHGAALQLGIKENEAIYIGDSRTDIEAAEAAGMHSIHLTVDDSHKDANAVVTEFAQIPEAVKQIAEAEK